MKILLLLQYPGYLRYFDSILRELTDRGHTVHLFFEQLQKQYEGLEAAQGMGSRMVIHEEAYPKRNDHWLSFADVVRASTDFVRYLEPEYATAFKLRDRMAQALPRSTRFLSRLPQLPVPVVRALQHFFALLERAIPTEPEIDDLMARIGPDVVLVSPLVKHASRQTDTIKTAKALGIPTGLLVGSWDHLTSKGMIRIKPDRVFVWNHVQKEEAVRLHGVDGSTVVVTGAQPFDKWFSRRPSVSREDFCAKVGLPSDRSYILFAGSTASISRPEAELEFVRHWVAALRATNNARLRDVPILIRPHPFNSEHWGDVNFDGEPNVSVYPRGPANPVNNADREDYFHSMWFSDAIVGINTSAMIEATILTKPVLTILADEFTGTQHGTLHFHYLLPENGGFLEVAKSIEEHIRQLERILDDPQTQAQRLSDFVDNFVRPNGRSEDATSCLVEGIVNLAALGPRPVGGIPAWQRSFKWLIQAVLAIRFRRSSILTKARKRTSIVLKKSAKTP